MKFHWNNQSHLPDFIILNTGWIEKYFQLEAVDKKLFKDPAVIFRDGGYILSITQGERVLGVCALMKTNETIYELARMAVDESEQGKGIGRLMLDEVIKHSQENDIKKLTIVSNTKLKAAIGLYKSYGFKVVSEGPHPIYQRGNIEMEKYI